MVSLARLDIPSIFGPGPVADNEPDIELGLLQHVPLDEVPHENTLHALTVVDNHACRVFFDSIDEMSLLATRIKRAASAKSDELEPALEKLQEQVGQLEIYTAACADYLFTNKRWSRKLHVSEFEMNRMRRDLATAVQTLTDAIGQTDSQPRALAAIQAVLESLVRTEDRFHAAAISSLVARGALPAEALVLRELATLALELPRLLTVCRNSGPDGEQALMQTRQWITRLHHELDRLNIRNSQRAVPSLPAFRASQHGNFIDVLVAHAFNSLQQVDELIGTLEPELVSTRKFVAALTALRTSLLPLAMGLNSPQFAVRGMHMPTIDIHALAELRAEDALSLARTRSIPLKALLEKIAPEQKLRYARGLLLAGSESDVLEVASKLNQTDLESFAHLAMLFLPAPDTKMQLASTVMTKRQRATLHAHVTKAQKALDDANTQLGSLDREIVALGTEVANELPVITHEDIARNAARVTLGTNQLVKQRETAALVVELGNRLSLLQRVDKLLDEDSLDERKNEFSALLQTNVVPEAISTVIIYLDWETLAATQSEIRLFLSRHSLNNQINALAEHLAAKKRVYDAAEDYKLARNAYAEEESDTTKNALDLASIARFRALDNEHLVPVQIEHNPASAGHLSMYMQDCFDRRAVFLQRHLPELILLDPKADWAARIQQVLGSQEATVNIARLVQDTALYRLLGDSQTSATMTTVLAHQLSKIVVNSEEVAKNDPEQVLDATFEISVRLIGQIRDPGTALRFAKKLLHQIARFDKARQKASALRLMDEFSRISHPRVKMLLLKTLNLSARNTGFTAAERAASLIQVFRHCETAVVQPALDVRGHAFKHFLECLSSVSRDDRATAWRSLILSNQDLGNARSAFPLKNTLLMTAGFGMLYGFVGAIAGLLGAAFTAEDGASVMRGLTAGADTGGALAVTQTLWRAVRSLPKRLRDEFIDKLLDDLDIDQHGKIAGNELRNQLQTWAPVWRSLLESMEDFPLDQQVRVINLYLKITDGEIRANLGYDETDIQMIQAELGVEHHLQTGAHLLHRLMTVIPAMGSNVLHQLMAVQMLTGLLQTMDPDPDIKAASLACIASALDSAKRSLNKKTGFGILALRQTISTASTARIKEMIGSISVAGASLKLSESERRVFSLPADDEDVKSARHSLDEQRALILEDVFRIDDSDDEGGSV